MTDGERKVRKLTQFSRQPHWLAERPNPYYSPLFKWTMKYVPLAMRLYRFYHYYLMEADFSGFYLESGRKIRDDLTKTQLDYMRRTAPEKYHAALTPKTEIGCKRKVMDTDYLACLHRENMELVSSDPITEITESGVRTKSGREVNADAIVLATGFQTEQMLYPLVIKGEKGITLNEHVCNPRRSQIQFRRLTKHIVVGQILRWPSASILRNLRIAVSQLLRDDGTKYRDGPFVRDLYHRMPDKFCTSGYSASVPDAISISTIESEPAERSQTRFCGSDNRR